LPLHVLVRNVGDADYYGPISFEDVTPFNEPISGYGPADVWQCAEGDFLSAFCRHEDVYLAPGEGVSVELFLPIAEEWAQPVFRELRHAHLHALAGRRGHKRCKQPVLRDCAGVPARRARLRPELALSQITSGYCETEGLCGCPPASPTAAASRLKARWPSRSTILPKA
jgi:hypothetical protein